MAKTGSTTNSGSGRAKSKRKPKSRPKWSPRELADRIAALASEKKAYNIVILEVGKLSIIADYLVICEGKSTRQVKAIAESTMSKLAKQRKKAYSSEGLSEGHWALLDYSDVVMHVFHEPLRKFYDLDGLWSDAPRFEYNDEPAEEKK